jgi:hypothetical protein
MGLRKRLIDGHSSHRFFTLVLEDEFFTAPIENPQVGVPLRSDAASSDKVVENTGCWNRYRNLGCVSTSQFQYLDFSQNI